MKVASDFRSFRNFGSLDEVIETLSVSSVPVLNPAHYLESVQLRPLPKGVLWSLSCYSLFLPGLR